MQRVFRATARAHQDEGPVSPMTCPIARFGAIANFEAVGIHQTVTSCLLGSVPRLRQFITYLVDIASRQIGRGTHLVVGRVMT